MTEIPETPGWRAFRWLLYGLLIAGPSLIVLLLVTVREKASLFDCIPFANDEVQYWNEIAAFERAGFSGGYCATNEQTAVASFTRFGPHGPGYPVVYGTLARMFGWRPYSGPLFNLGLLAAATGVWLFGCRPDVKRAATAALVLGTFWPCLLYLPSTMQEGLHCALALLIAAAAHHSLTRGGGGPLFLTMGIGLFVAAALIRVTWCGALIPFVWVSVRHLGWRRQVGALAAALGLVAFLGWVSTEICSPYPNFLTTWLELRGRLPKSPSTVLAEHAGTNFAHFVVRPEGSRDNDLAVLLRYQVLALLVIALLCLAARWRTRVCPWTHLFGAANLLLVLVVVIAAYDVGNGRDFRVLAPHLLLALLVLATSADPRWALGFAVANLLFLFTFLESFDQSIRRRMRLSVSEIHAMQEALEPYVRYEEADSGWDNTILVPMSRLHYPLLGVPHGVGVAPVFDNRLPREPRSRFVLVRPEEAEPINAAGKVELRPLTTTPLGVLYLNVKRQ